jgi:hypothetical protein
VLDAYFLSLLLIFKVIRELSGLILTRGPKLCNFVEWRGYKVVYRRYGLSMLLSSTFCFIGYAAFAIFAY